MAARRNLVRARYPGRTLGVLAALAAIGILHPVSRAAGAHLDITPSISLDQVYDSNVFNTDGNEKEDFILRATPALTFSLRMPETTLNLRTSLTSDTYYKYTVLNHTNSAIALAVDATPIRMTPRFSMTPSAHYVEARDSYRRNQLMPSGDPLVQPSIASETAVRKTRDYGGAMRINYLVTPNTDFSVGGGFSKLQFLDRTAFDNAVLDNAAGNIGSRVITGDASISYRFTPLLSSGLFVNTAYNTFDNGRDSRTLAGGLTGSYRYSPTFTATARAGASRAKESGNPGIPDRTSWSPSGSLTLAWLDNAFQASLAGSVDYSGGGGLGFTTRRESVTFLLSDQFAARWWADLSGNCQRNQSLDPAESEDLTSASGTAGIRYQVLEWATVRLSGTAFRQWSNGVIGTDLTRYSAFIGFMLAKPINIY